MCVDFLSKADWLHEDRVIGYARFLCSLYALAAVLWIVLSPGLVDPKNKPIGTDFMSFWAAGRLALGGNPGDAYDYSRHFEVERQALPWHKGQQLTYFPWHYPPMFLLIATLLAMLPYGIALTVWLLLTLLAYLATIRSVIPYPRWLLIALAFPAVFVNVGHGQNGFLTVGLLGGGLLLLERKAVLAGVLFGMLSFKPQFAILLPFVLVVSRQWRAFLSMAVSGAAAAAVSYAVFGATTWWAFFASLQLTRGYMLESGAAGWEKMQSTFSGVRMLGGSIEVAYASQAIVGCVAVGAAVWVWRKQAGMRLKGAALMAASLLATPYVLDYDLMLLSLPIAWLAAEGLEAGFFQWEKIGIFAAYLLPLFARPIGTIGVPTAPVVLLCLLGLIVRRTFKMQASAALSPPINTTLAPLSEA